LPDFSQASEELFLRALPDAARVDHDDVGVAVIGRRLIPGLLQEPSHPLGVVDVHLAAEGLDQILAPHRPSLSLSCLFRFALN
jgi:hypothetical protein